jgi:imidazoleglycerol phosphate synthase glutamine amidotransferase subunit HisH
MKPASDQDIQAIREKYAQFLNEKNTALKSAYLAVSSLGFNNVIKSNSNAVMLSRDEDKTFVVCSYPVAPDEVTVIKHERIVRFHTENVFKGDK